MRKWSVLLLSAAVLIGVFILTAPTAQAVSSEFEVEDGIIIAYNGAGGDVEIPDGIAGIEREAFEGCTSIRSVSIPASVTSLHYTFLNCTSLERVYLSEGIVDIQGAFEGCTSLKNVNLPDGIVDIGWAFVNCSALTSISLPDSVKYVNGAFAGCSSLTSVNLPDGIAELSRTFYGCAALQSVVVPDSVTVINDGAFYNCKSLSAITLSKNLVGIDMLAFSGAGGLTEIHFPYSLTWIGERAFQDCTGLKSITLPSQLSDIEEQAFWGCDSLRSVVMLNPKGTGIGSIPFPSGTTLYAYPVDVTRHYADLGGMNFVSINRDTVIAPGDFAATLDGNPVTLRSYAYQEETGGSTNYVLLHDVAAMLNGTAAQFSVDWSAEHGISIATDQAYMLTGSELRGKAQDMKPYKKREVILSIDGKPVELTAIFIDGNNYFALRELGAALGFGVAWEHSTVVIQSDVEV